MKPRWGINLEEFKRRFDPGTTHGEGKQRPSFVSDKHYHRKRMLNNFPWHGQVRILFTESKVTTTLYNIVKSTIEKYCSGAFI